MKTFLVILVFYYCSSFGQNVQIDSLKLALKSANHDSIRCQILDALSELEPDENIWPLYNEQLQVLAEKNIMLGGTHTKLYQGYLSVALNNKGYLYSSQGDIPKALAYHYKSLKIQEEIGDKQGIAITFNNIGAIYDSQGNITRALECYQKSLKYFEETNDKAATATALSNIAVLYKHQGEVSKALENNKRSLAIREEIKDKDGTASSLINIGSIYMGEGDTEKALSHYERSLKLLEEVGDVRMISKNLNNIGFLYETKGELLVAQDYYQKSLAIQENILDKEGIALSLNNLARVMLKSEKIDEALVYANRGMKIAKELGYPASIRNLAGTLKSIYHKQNNYKSAFDMYELEIKMRDSINNNEIKKAVIKKEIQYTYEKKELEAKAEQDRKDMIILEEMQKQKIVRNIFVIGSLTFLLFGIYFFRNLRISRKNNRIISGQKKEAIKQKSEVEEKNREIKQSIEYALRIQTAILPTRIVKQYLEKSFILYKPKDIVAGDFYWIEIVGETILFAACDCTGHGVPGAMVSVVCHNALNRAVREFGLTQPAAILDKTAAIVVENFSKSEEEIKDGMDISLCAIQRDTTTKGGGGVRLQWAGANNPLWLLRNGELLEEKANKQPIGMNENSMPFTNHEYILKSGDCIYVFTDGFADQFGGETGQKKLTRKRFKELILSVQNQSLQEQGNTLDNFITDYRKEVEQIDDILVIGVKV